MGERPECFRRWERIVVLLAKEGCKCDPETRKECLAFAAPADEGPKRETYVSVKYHTHDRWSDGSRRLWESNAHALSGTNQFELAVKVIKWLLQNLPDLREEEGE